jgi:hypothetical protein
MIAVTLLCAITYLVIAVTLLPAEPKGSAVFLF